MLRVHWKLKLATFLVLVAWAGGMVAGASIVAGNAQVRQVDQGGTLSAAESRALDLYHAHDCWRDEPPADMRGRVPGHVVVTTRHGRTTYGGPRLVSRALSQLFEDEPAGLRVWSFCR
jgi:hypothetical protein